ncbi:hypothetical protein GCM10010404_81890 [Nonomuraea africana]|uniref:Uncharacterized protein n=1 Tax=Nonomuraea africana TaxID=46171 RepID=A0ABR9KXS6_9ACTN|nr:hypothetical protein [Nonomuraea africana]MBE1566576.1 hypothetical protein [Nonomuraea africana]
MTTVTQDQHASEIDAEAPVGFVVVDVAQAGDNSGWMTPRMRATRKQAHEDLEFWRGTARSGSSMDLRVAKIVLVDAASSAGGEA